MTPSDTDMSCDLDECVSLTILLLFFSLMALADDQKPDFLCMDWPQLIFWATETRRQQQLCIIVDFFCPSERLLMCFIFIDIIIVHH